MKENLWPVANEDGQDCTQSGVAEEKLALTESSGAIYAATGVNFLSQEAKLTMAICLFVFIFWLCFHFAGAL